MTEDTRKDALALGLGSLGSGEHSSMLAGPDLAPGLYFVRLASSRGIRTARAVVVR